MFTTPTLTVSLPAIVANWQLLRAQFTGEECAAVVKADAYGLGALPVAKALADAGCHSFFVATLDEAIKLRAALPDVRILVFHGVQKGEEFAFASHRLIPVLNSHEQLQRWKQVAAEHIHAVSALHIDTAMGRLGLQPEEFAALMKQNDQTLEECRVGLVMSHLACAPEPAHPLNTQQLNIFKQIASHAVGIPASLCNSGGIFLSRDYHFNLARPGCSLYGIAPQSKKDSGFRIQDSGKEKNATSFLSQSGNQSSALSSFPESRIPNPESLLHVATWSAPILMTRTLTREQTIGYGATATAAKGTRIATVASGYADGYLRYLSNKGLGYISDHPTKLVGRVTMDMLCFDVTNIPESLTHEGAMITLLGDRDGIRVDDVAARAGTIGYEILTHIGARVKRVYS